MQAEMIGAVITRVQSIESDVTAARRMVDGTTLAVSDRQYLERCFDLLDMEVRALLQYLEALHEPW